MAGCCLPALPNTGDVIRTLPAPSSCVTGIVSDGHSLWGVDRKTDRLYRVDPSGGKVIATLKSPGYFPTGLAWDGTGLWVSDIDFVSTSAEIYSGKVYRIDPSSGLTTHAIMTPGNSPQGLAWDGEYLWVSDNETDMLYRISPEDGTIIHSFQAPAKDPGGLAWDGQYLWVSDHGRDEIYRVHPEKGIVVMVLDTPGPYAWGLAWKDDRLWCTDYQEDRLYEMEIFSNEPYRRTNLRSAAMEFTSDVINFGPGSLTSLELYVAEPVDRPSQEVLEVSYPVQPDGFHTDRWDQKVARFGSSGLAPGSRVIRSMKVQADIYEVTFNIFPEKVGSPEDIPAEIKEKYLEDEEKYRMDHPVIRQAVSEITTGETNPYWIARNIFDYLREKLYYDRTGGWDIAPTVLERGSGSCSEYAFLYISMCRAAGIPARYVGSVVVRGEAASFDYVYHRWVEVYLPGFGWIPVDPSGGDKELPADQADYFGHLDNRFLITTQGGGGSEYLGWDYNSSHSWKADGPVQLREEKIAEWDPVADPSDSFIP